MPDKVDISKFQDNPQAYVLRAYFLNICTPPMLQISFFEDSTENYILELKIAF